MKVYLDTSVINGLFADDAPWIKDATLEFFTHAGKKDVLFVSDLVIAEIERTVDPVRRKKLLQVIEKQSLKILEVNEEAESLAKIYIDEGIIPHQYLPDALHIAVAVVHKLPVIVSWNFKHLVRHHTRMKVNEVNRRRGLIFIDICSPEEVD